MMATLLIRNGSQRICRLSYQRRNLLFYSRSKSANEREIPSLSLKHKTYTWSPRCFSSISKNNESPDKQKKEESNETVLTRSDAVWNVPNTLTMARIVATPFVGYLIYCDYYEYAIASFFVAGFMDWLDGYLARKLNQMSVFGSFLDPLADKVFVGTTLLALCVKGLVPWQLGLLIIGRDVVLVGGSFYVRHKTKPLGASFFATSKEAGITAVEASTISKFNTLAQFGLIWFTLTSSAWGLPPSEYLPALWLTIGGTTFASGYDYYRRSNYKNIFNTKKTG
mmetsp:Transcript_11739/g.14251  ORF Transcript_11739/g.14251 Transcript_11739/m.14251 type:complete len:281 (-) Transcript_11739:1273-2115(-)